MKLIFVYGTLKRGNGLHGALEGAEFVGEAITLEPNFKMFCKGVYPYVSHVGRGGYRIIGEAYNVPELIVTELDWVEGHPTRYCRTDTEFMLEDGNIFMGQMYIYTGDNMNSKEITSGCWFSPASVKLENNPKKDVEKV